MTTSQKCKIIKQILAEEFGRDNVSVRKGTGTASHWIEVTVWVVNETRRAEVKTREIISNYKPTIELSTYYTDDPVAEERNCLLVNIRKLYKCGHKPEAHPALSRFGHGDICSTCGTREAFEGDFISVLNQ